MSTVSLGACLRSQLGWDLLIPFLAAAMLSLLLFGLLQMLAALFVLVGAGMWLGARNGESKSRAAAVLLYGMVMVPPPTFVMIIALLTTRNQ